MVNLIIRYSTALGMVIVAVVVYNIYPHNPFNNSLITALVCWSVALAPLRWIEIRIDDMVTSVAAHDFWKWCFLFLQIGFIIAGSIFLFIGLPHIF